VDLVHGATGPPWTGDHCRTWGHQSSAFGRSDARELRPRGGGGEGRAGELNGRVTAVGRLWRGVSPVASGSAIAETVVELRRGGGCRGGVMVVWCSSAFYRVEGRSGGEAAALWSSIMSYFGRGSTRWWEVMWGSALAISEVEGGSGQCDAAQAGGGARSGSS
jgi:hypothetical protein